MIIRQALNFAAHLVAGIAVGALAVAAYSDFKRRQDDEWRGTGQLDQETDADDPI